MDSHSQFDPQLAADYASRLRTLTARERTVVRLASEGLPNKRIASRLGLSIKTVEKSRRQAYSKLQVGSTAGMTRVVLLAEFFGMEPIRCANCQRTL